MFNKLFDDDVIGESVALLAYYVWRPMEDHSFCSVI